MHLHDDPLTAALFERACPAAIVPANGLSVPLGVVIEETRIPGGVSHLSEFHAQIADGEIGGLEFIQERSPNFLNASNPTMVDFESG